MKSALQGQVTVRPNKKTEKLHVYQEGRKKAEVDSIDLYDVKSGSDGKGFYVKGGIYPKGVFDKQKKRGLTEPALNFFAQPNTGGWEESLAHRYYNAASGARITAPNGDAELIDPRKI